MGVFGRWLLLTRGYETSFDDDRSELFPHAPFSGKVQAASDLQNEMNIDSATKAGRKRSNRLRSREKARLYLCVVFTELLSIYARSHLRPPRHLLEQVSIKLVLHASLSSNGDRSENLIRFKDGLSHVLWFYADVSRLALKFGSANQMAKKIRSASTAHQRD